MTGVSWSRGCGLIGQSLNFLMLTTVFTSGGECRCGVSPVGFVLLYAAGDGRNVTCGHGSAPEPHPSLPVFFQLALKPSTETSVRLG